MKLVLADDHAMVREALKAYLERAASGISVIECSSLDEALEATDRSAPVDVTVLDLRMPGMNGLEGLSRFRQAYAHIPVAIMSGTAMQEDVREALDFGAAGFLPKTLSGPAFLSAVQLISAGERFVPYDLSALDSAAGGPDPDADFGLSEREKSVLAWLAEGLSNKEIARHLDLQEVTIKLHVRSICRKLGAKNRTQAALRAAQLGYGQRVAQRA